MIIFLNKFSKHLNVILSISHLKSTECTKLRRVYTFASLVARYVTRLRYRNAMSFKFAITSFCRSENYWWKYKYKFEFEEYVTDVTVSIDLTFLRPTLRKHLCEWTILEEESLSDYRYVCFELQSGKRDPPQGKPRGWAYTTEISHACDASMRRRRLYNNQRPAFWWNTEFSELWKSSIKQQRKAQRARKKDVQKNKRKGIGARTPESCFKTPSSKARGNAGKFCAPISTETHGTLSIAYN